METFVKSLTLSRTFSSLEEHPINLTVSEEISTMSHLPRYQYLESEDLNMISVIIKFFQDQSYAVAYSAVCYCVSIT